MVVVARVAHEIPERRPLQLAVGEAVEIGERSAQWPTFVFVTTRTGSGWVPARHLSAASGSAVVREAYDTTELPTQVGDRLAVLVEDRESGWLWCRGGDGHEGWVPIDTVDRPSPS
jgi:hypothetical protein